MSIATSIRSQSPPDRGVRTPDTATSHLEGPDGFQAYSSIGDSKAAGILENGPGSTDLLRADIDALPHLENRKLECTSTQEANGE